MSKKMEMRSMEMRSRVHLIKKKKVPMKRSRRKKNQLLKKVLGYFKSDSFMFAPLDSSRLSDSSSPDILPSVSAGNEPTKKKLLQRIGDFLKSDSYLYGPMVTSQPLDLAAMPAASAHLTKGSVSIQEKSDKSRLANTLDGGSEVVGEPGWMTSSVIRKGQNMDSVHPATSAVVTRSRVREEMVKQMIYQNC